MSNGNDLKRVKKRSLAPLGQTTPIGDLDPHVRALAQQEHENIELLARRISELAERLARHETSILGRPPAKVKAGAKRPPGPPLSDIATEKQVAEALVKAIQNDILSCEFFDPTLGGSNGIVVNVAKPYLLRRTPFHGQTIFYPNGQSISYSYTDAQTRTATYGVDTETQMITPMYFINERIRIVLCNTGLFDGSGEKVKWEDANTAGRHWTEV